MELEKKESEIFFLMRGLFELIQETPQELKSFLSEYLYKRFHMHHLSANRL